MSASAAPPAPARPTRALPAPRWVVLGAGATAGVFLLIGLGATWQLLQAASWSGGALGGLPALAALGSASYLLRFLRWHLLARRVAPELRLLPSLRIYLAGFALGLTPGRVGELCKFTLLREESGVVEARSVPIFPIERATEAASFAALAVLGAALGPIALGGLGPGAIAAIAAIPALALLGLALRRHGVGGSPAGLAPWVAAGGGGASWPRQMVAGARAIASPRALLLALACAAVARGCDALLFWTAAALVGSPLPLAGAALAFGLAGLAGGLLLMPAGVGAVEGSLVATAAALGADPASALVAAVLARCLTLWIWVPGGLWLAFRAASPRPSLSGLVRS